MDSPFGDDGAEGYYHIHYGITDYSADWNCWSTDINGDCHGVNREFAGGGRMVIGVSDNMYHPSFDGGFDDDHMQLTINQINWLDTGSITGIPTTPPPVSTVPLPAAGWMLLAAMGGIAASRRRR